MSKQSIFTMVAILLTGGVVASVWYAVQKPGPRDLSLPPIYEEPGYTQPEPQKPPIQATRVNRAVIPKELFEGGIKDLEISVGNVFGAFTVAEIEESPQGSYRIVFSGDTTVRGHLQHNAFPALVFTVDNSETEKLPQLYKSVYSPTVTFRSLVISNASVVSSVDFDFTDGNSNGRYAEVHITNLRMFIPPTNTFGTAEASSIIYLD